MAKQRRVHIAAPKAEKLGAMKHARQLESMQKLAAARADADYSASLAHRRAYEAGERERKMRELFDILAQSLPMGFIGLPVTQLDGPEVYEGQPSLHVTRQRPLRNFRVNDIKDLPEHVLADRLYVVVGEIDNMPNYRYDRLGSQTHYMVKVHTEIGAPVRYVYALSGKSLNTTPPAVLRHQIAESLAEGFERDLAQHRSQRSWG